MFILFFAIWLILNGKISLEICIFGLVVSVLMFLFICKFMDYSIKKEIRLIKCAPSLVYYLLVLIWEILKANGQVIGMIFNSKYELEPAVVTFDSPIKSRFLNTILANSITLTPGTITVAQEGSKFTVHALDKDLLVGIDDSVFVHLLLKLEGGKNYA